jgi:hypothetical protein
MNKKTTLWLLLLCLGSASAGYWTNEWIRNRAERARLFRMIEYAITEGYLLVDTNRLYADSADYAADMDAPLDTTNN